MPKKMTTEEFIEKAKGVHGEKYDYSNTIYLGNAKKVEIVCNTCRKTFSTLANDHLSKKVGCLHCSGLVRLTFDEFTRRSILTHGDKFSYDRVVISGVDSKVSIGCPNGHYFEQTPRAHYSGQGCNICASTSKKSTEKFIEDSKVLFGDKFDYSKTVYVNAITKVTLICKNMGEFEITPTSHLNSSTGYNLEIANSPASLQDFINRSKSVHGDMYSYDKVTYTTNKSDVIITCQKHGDFEQSPHNHYKGSGCPKCACGRTESKPEVLLQEMLSGQNMVLHDRTIIDKELDILLPDLKLAIEVNGVYYHSEDKVGKTRHLSKTEACEKIGLKLLHFTDVEILDKTEIVKSMLDNNLGKSIKIGARSLRLGTASHLEYTKFFNENHISGSCSAKVAYGLFNEDSLICCMSFSKPRFDTDSEWEVIRFATKLGHTVVGGSSKLLKHFIKEHKPKSIMTYADRRFGNGSVYSKIGFELIGKTEVGYSYYKTGKPILNRVSAQKHKLSKLLGDKFDHNLTSDENLRKCGYHKVYNCGNYKFRLTLQ